MGFRDEAIGSVYFFIRGDFIKVGFTIDVRRRLYGLDGGFDDFLAVVEDCTMADEKAAHARLKAWRAHGEWFHATDKCLDAIQWLVEGGLRSMRTPVKPPPVPDRFVDQPAARWPRVRTAPDFDARELVQTHIQTVAEAGSPTITCPQIRRMEPLIPRTRNWIRVELKRLCDAPSSGEIGLARVPGQAGVYIIRQAALIRSGRAVLGVVSLATPLTRRFFANAGHHHYTPAGGSR